MVSNRKRLLARWTLLLYLLFLGYWTWRYYHRSSSGQTLSQGDSHLPAQLNLQLRSGAVKKELAARIIKTTQQDLNLDGGPLPRKRRDKLFPCDDSTTPQSYHSLGGNYWVLHNYFKASKSFLCDEAITYTTIADWTFLDNLVPLLERWKQGPISLALYAPGTDFDASIKSIQYLRECSSSSPLVKELVTFHIFFDLEQKPPTSKLPLDPTQLPVNCSDDTIAFGEGLQTYRDLQKLAYPINVARNIAREMATTHYLLPSDIELYPSPNLVPNFLQMIHLNKGPLQRPTPRVFVVPVFEVDWRVAHLPNDKGELVGMLKNKSAVPFHKYICPECHRLPNERGWLKAALNDSDALRVFPIGHRHKPYQHWEPFYIGRKCDPDFDERLSWDGRKNKMVQGYLLCLLNYEFHILDNAFLVHRPGIKKKASKRDRKRKQAQAIQNSLISKTILPELKQIFGERPECFV